MTQDLIETHLQHQLDLYHNVINFKKAFCRVWQEDLLIMGYFNFDNLILFRLHQRSIPEQQPRTLLQNNRRSAPNLSPVTSTLLIYTWKASCGLYYMIFKAVMQSLFFIADAWYRPYGEERYRARGLHHQHTGKDIRSLWDGIWKPAQRKAEI